MSAYNGGYKKSWFETSPLADWLYGGWDEKKLKQFELGYSVPGVRNYLDYLLDVRADKEYLNRYGMDYSNIHDPRKLRETSSASSTVGFVSRTVSKNVGKLYK